ncbi:hypothetical protein C8Q70DRAFT_587970 [Cubamyces menziesii]|nr:hypothetical protein C8Q70DRAFT_587970 [Cubamyces menziesii]
MMPLRLAAYGPWAVLSAETKGGRGGACTKRQVGIEMQGRGWTSDSRAQVQGTEMAHRASRRVRWEEHCRRTRAESSLGVRASVGALQADERTGGEEGAYDIVGGRNMMPINCPYMASHSILPGEKHRFSGLPGAGERGKEVGKPEACAQGIFEADEDVDAGQVSAFASVSGVLVARGGGAPSRAWTSSLSWGGEGCRKKSCGLLTSVLDARRVSCSPRTRTDTSSRPMAHGPMSATHHPAASAASAQGVLTEPRTAYGRSSGHGCDTEVYLPARGWHATREADQMVTVLAGGHLQAARPDLHCPARQPASLPF